MNNTDIHTAILEAMPTALHLLESVVNINSYSRNPAGVNQVEDHFQAAFEALGLKTSRTRTPTCGDILVAESATGVSRGTVLIGHADTVYPPSSPFQRFSRDGDIARGPGVLDMKGGLLVALLALQALHATKLLARVPLAFVINPDEEIGSNESAHVIQEYARKSNGALVFEWGRTNNMLITKRKGVGMFELRVAGRAAHSGNAHAEGRNAIQQLAHTIGRLQSLTNYATGTTVNVGLVQGGSSVNTVPALATASFDARVTSREAREELRRAFVALASDIVVPETSVVIEERSFSAPLEESDQTTEMVNRFMRAARDAGLTCTKTERHLGGGSDANTTAAVGTPTIDGLGPMGDGAHSEQEHIVLSSIAPRATAVALFLAGTAAP